MPPTPASGRRPAGRVVGAIVLALAVVFVSAGPAAADPAKPTNYRSKVTRVAPALPAGVSVRVVGGDGFLELSAKGHDVEVLDEVQGQEAAARPYLRIRRDGTVQLNKNSIGYYYNATRFGSPVPKRIERPGLEPDWEDHGTSGRYVWHDHRIHWMSPGKPPSVQGSSGKVAMGGPDGDWVVPLVVDGRPTRVFGELYLDEAPNPILPVGLALVVAAALIGLGPRSPLLVATAATVVAGAVGVLVGIGQFVAIPPAAGQTPLSWALPGVALAAGVAAVVLKRPPPRVVAVLAGAAALGGWVLMRWTVLTKAVLPTDLPGGIDRYGTALVLGLAVAVAVVAVRSGLLATPPPRPSAEGATATPPA